MADREQDFVQRVLADEKERGLLEEIIKAIKEIDYGYIQITIHDSKVVQIDKTARTRVKI